MSDLRSLLSAQALSEALANLPGWTESGKAIHKSFKFEGYPPAVMFANAVAFAAQKMDHHPDLALGYGEVKVSISTHTAGGVTGMDVRLAKAIEAL